MTRQNFDDQPESLNIPDGTQPGSTREMNSESLIANNNQPESLNIPDGTQPGITRLMQNHFFRRLIGRNPQMKSSKNITNNV